VSTAMRLKRTGTTKRPCYRIVVIDSRNANKGGIIANVGINNPRDSKAESQWKLDEEGILGWLKKGAQPSESVKSLLSKAGLWAKFKTPVKA